MGAALLQHALAAQPEPLRSLKVISAGIASRTGEPISSNAVIALKKVGIDLKAHLSQPITQELLDHSILVLCMTKSHRNMIEETAYPVPPRVHLFREFVGTKDNMEIPDPYGLHLQAYEVSRDEMVDAVPSIIAYLSKLPREVLSGR